MSKASGVHLGTLILPMGGTEAFWTVGLVWGMNGFIQKLIWSIWHPQNRSRMPGSISETLKRNILTNARRS